MTTSGTYDYSTTAGEIITDALGLLGVLAAGETCSAEDYATGLRYLNKLCKFLAIDADLWVTTDITHTLTPGVTSYEIGIDETINTAKPLRLKAARRVDSFGTTIPVEVVSRSEYMELPRKDTQAPCLMAYYNSQRTTGTIYVWPTGSAGNTTLILTFQRPLQDVDLITNEPDFPQEWLLPLTYQLAVAMAPNWIGTIPPALKAEAEQMLARVTVFDDEQVSITLSGSGR